MINPVQGRVYHFKKIQNLENRPSTPVLLTYSRGSGMP